ncbi:MAG: RDD family protein [Ascidiaceihabitans sp.]|tara:strand:- start:1350 stop:1787 length:438 start_codon:yes stop_codon:yes gene_type:complete
MTHLPDTIAQAAFYETVPTNRLFAWILDAAIILEICLVVLPFTGFLGIFFWPLMWLVVGFAYRTITIANRSATWGMRLVSIELRNRTGARLDLTKAIFHTLGYIISIGIFLLQAVSIVLICASMRGQSLIDHVLGAVMLKKQARR